jgi:hypothetical protein
MCAMAALQSAEQPVRLQTPHSTLQTCFDIREAAATQPQAAVRAARFAKNALARSHANCAHRKEYMYLLRFVAKYRWLTSPQRPLRQKSGNRNSGACITNLRSEGKDFHRKNFEATGAPSWATPLYPSKSNECAECTSTSKLHSPT